MKTVSTRRAFISGTAATAALARCWGGGFLSAAKARRLNILYIMTDDHAAHAIGAYGSRINKTPHMDEMARSGMILSNCFCTNPICTPSRGGILTGEYSHRNGVPVFNNISRDKKTVGGYMRDAGYYTAFVGKWHLGGPKTVRDEDWDRWMVYANQGVYFNPWFWEKKDGKIVRTDYPGEYATENITRVTKDVIDGARATGKPFFVMMHHKAPHRNWLPSDKYRAKFRAMTLKDIPIPATLFDDWKGRASPIKTTAMTVLRHMRLKEDLRYMQDYLACVQSVDDSVGEMRAYLKEKGILDDTLVIYTSDQGFFLGDHGLYDKRFMMEEVIKMPMIVSCPRLIKPGSVNGDMVTNIDFAPTFLDIANAPKPKQMQGESFLPNLEGKTPSNWRKDCYFRYYVEGGEHATSAWYGIRTETDKLMYYYKRDEWEYFDLVRDPEELSNEYANPRYAERVAALKKRLYELKASLGDTDQYKDAKEYGPIGR